MKKCLLVSIALFLTLPLFAEESPRLIVHLLDYLAKDYAGAVGDNGQILSESEYAEQREFAEIILKTVNSTPELSGHDSLKEEAKRLEGAISSRAAPSIVTTLARSLQQEVVQVSGLVMSPNKWPNLATGAELYSQKCAICHGATGAGDGPAGVALDPPPANFRDVNLMSELAPSGAFNTIRLGVPGTGMPPFPTLSDEQVWALAFYVVSLHHTKPTSPQAVDVKLLSEVATLPDSKLQEKLGEDPLVLGSIRTFSPEQEHSRQCQDASERDH